MPVEFPGGIVLDIAARSRIRAACIMICCGVSNITPAGAGPNLRSVGRAE